MAAAVRLVVALGAICVLLFPAGAAGLATPTNFRFTTPVPLVIVQTSPSAVVFLTDPVKTGVPRVGRATVQVQFATCSPFPCEPTGSANMLTRVTVPGGTLVLSGGSSSPDEHLNTGTWTVTEATGRFAGYTGAGTYTWIWTGAPSNPGTATLTLAGHLGLE